MSIRPRRRHALMGATAFVTASALSFLGLSVPAYAAEGDNSQALAQFLGSNSDLLATQLLNVGTASSSSPGGPVAQTNPLNLQALQALGLQLEVIGDGLEVPLITNGQTPGLLTLGQLGAVQNYAASTPTGSTAASGLVSNDGTIAVSQNASPSDFGNSTINLTSLLAQLGIAGATGPVIDTLGLEVGAVATRIDWTAGGAPIADYRVTDLKANVHSALVGALATNLRAAGVTVGTTASGSLNALVGTQGLLTQVVTAVPPINVLGLASVSLGKPTIAVNLANLGTVVDTALGTNSILVSDDGSVTINLTTGTVSVNLAKIVNPGGPNLNGLAPNTSVLTADTLLKITAGVSNALGKVLAPVTAAAKLALHQSTVTVSLQVTATLLPVLGNTGKLVDAPITISGTLDELATGNGQINTAGLVLLPNIPLCIGVPTGGGGCLGVNLNGLVGALVASVVQNVVQPLLGVLGPQVLGVLTAGDTQIDNGLGAVVTPVINGLSPVLDGVLASVVDITINEQPQALVPPQDGDLGPDSATVRALSVTLLPRLLGSTVAKVSLGSSTVQALPAPTLNIVETTIVEGNDITVQGAAFDDTAQVSVAFTDGNNQPVGVAQVFTPDAGGTFSFTRNIPTGTQGPVKATATQGVFAPTDSVVVTGAPTFNILETTVDEDGEITTVGSNWVPGVDVTIVLTDDEDTEVGTFVVVPGIDGSFNVATAVPAGVTGTITATATQAPVTELSDTVDVVADTPLVNIVQSTAVAGSTITLEGSEWAAGTVDIEFTDAAGTNLGNPLAVTVGGSGVFTGISWPVPLTALGTVTATASQGGDTALDAVLVTAAPSLDIVEPSVVAGQDVMISGGGWAPTPLTVNLADGFGNTDTVEVTPLADGTFSIDYTVPVTWRGVLTATVSHGGTDRADTADILDPPVIDIVQSTVPEGTPVTVNGSGWNQAFLVFIDFNDGNGNLITTVPTGVTAGGTFTVEFTIPVDTVGPVTAVATDGANTATDVVDVTVVPTVTIAETTVAPGDTINISGTKWTPGDVVLTFTDANNAPLGAITTPAGGTGLIAATWPVPEGTVGPVTVTASQAPNTAVDTVAVTPEPSLNIAELSVLAGQDVHLSGSNWSPMSLVTISFTDVNGDAIPGSQQVYPLGNGDISATFTVPVGTLGPITGTASQNGDLADDSVDVIPVANVNIVEDEVVPGDDITIEGDDWLPEQNVTITYYDGTTQVGVPVDVPTDEFGDFTVIYTVPPGTVGPIRVSVSQGPVTDEDSAEIIEDADTDADVAIDADADATDAAGVDAAADADGVDAAGVDAAGVDAAGVDAAGVDAAGVDAAGVDAAADTDGVDAAGVDAAADTDGVDAAGVDAAADTDAIDTDAIDTDAIDTDAIDTDAIDAAADTDAIDADAVDTDSDAVDVAADADAVDVAVDSDVVDADSDAVDVAADAAADVADADVIDADADAVDVAADAAADVAADADAVDVAADADADAAADADAVDVAADADADAAAAADAAADADAGPIPAVLPQATVQFTTIKRGTGVSQQVYGIGFQPGEIVSATVFSTPFALTPQIADGFGNVTFAFPVGGDFQLGAHRVEFVGSISGAMPAERESTNFTVTGVAASVLAATGFEAVWLAALAGLFLLAGAGGIGVTRRRQSRVH